MPPQSTKVSFVGIDSADVKLPGDNQRVPILVFKVTWIIYIVDFKHKRWSGVLIVCLEALMQALSIVCLTATYASRFSLKQVFGILMG